MVITRKHETLWSTWKKLSSLTYKSLAKEELSWLAYSGSFIGRLKEYGLLDAYPLQISVVSQGLVRGISLEGSYPFHCHYFYHRVINLFLGETPVLHARSWMPKDMSIIYKRSFRNLGTHPLKNILFGNPSIKRSDIELQKITHRHPLFCSTWEGPHANTAYFWGRRSLFSTDAPLLLLLELFSFDFFELIK